MRRPNRRRAFTTFAAALMLASQAASHPGHGLGGGSTHWLHYLSDPLHAAPWAVAALVLVLLVRARRSVRRPTR
jgi:hypothetical protein